jgi:LysM repeat protein
MSEETDTKQSTIGQLLVWVLAGVVIGLALFALSLLATRRAPAPDTGPSLTPTATTILAAQEAAPVVAQVDVVATATPALTLITYTVQAGDVLGAIAEKFGIGTQALLQANASTLSNPDQLQIGQVLFIPVGAEQIQAAQVIAAATSIPPTPLPPGVTRKHTIARGEVLSTIAERYGVTVAAIRAANNLRTDTIRAGDTLLIPIPGGSNASATTTEPSNTTSNGRYPFSILEGDLAQGYPLTAKGSNFTVHYQPDSPAAQDIKAIVAFLEQAQRSIVRSLGVRFTGRFDVYLAGSLFAPPNQSLRGRSFSAQRRAFVLYDSSGNAAEKRYMLAHELTHLIAWNTYGPAKSPMLSEGAAVFAGEQYLVAGKFLSIRNFCLAYRRADVLPLVASSNLNFGGHLLSQDVYYASGCFAQYLFKTYGAARFGRLYSSLDYQAAYGRTLDQLQRAWLANLDADRTRLPFTASELPAAYESLIKEYGEFFANVEQGDVDVARHRELNERRLNVLMGKL